MTSLLRKGPLLAVDSERKPSSLHAEKQLSLLKKSGLLSSPLKVTMPNLMKYLTVPDPHLSHLGRILEDFKWLCSGLGWRLDESVV